MNLQVPVSYLDLWHALDSCDEKEISSDIAWKYGVFGGNKASYPIFNMFWAMGKLDEVIIPKQDVSNELCDGQSQIKQQLDAVEDRSPPVADAQDPYISRASTS